MTIPVPGPPRPADPRVASPDPGAVVARAMAGLDGLGERPLADHVEVFERVHAARGEALAAGAA